MTTLKDNISKLRRDVDLLKSTDMSMNFGTVEILDVPVMPLSTTEDEVRVEKTINIEFEVDTDVEILRVLRKLHMRALLRLNRPW